MLDLTTPFDPDTTMVTLSSPDVAMSQPAPTDYAFDLTVEADVLAKAGTFDLDVQSTTASTRRPSSPFQISARAPKALTSTAQGTGMITTVFDTALFQFTPRLRGAGVRAVHRRSSMAGQVSRTAIPKSGKYADALSGFGIRYGQGTTSTDLFYVVVGDSNSIFGAGPTPADLEVTAFESPCTAAVEETETAAANNDTAAGAQAVTTLPALVKGTLGYGAVDGTMDTDYYSFTVPAGATKIHVATGGDPLDDTVLEVFDSTMTSVATSDDLDYQEDLVVTGAHAGMYFVAVTASNSGAFSAADNTYQLFIATE